MFKYSVRCLSSVGSVAVRRPIAITSVAARTPSVAPARSLSFFKAPTEATGIPDEKDFAKGTIRGSHNRHHTIYVIIHRC